MHSPLNFPDYTFSFQEKNGVQEIFDAFRRKFVKLTPEEWVRQNLLHFLVKEKGYPTSLIAVEYSLTFNGQKKRCDALIFNSLAQPLVLVECKSEQVVLTQKILEQVSRYNFTLNVPYLLISNGLKHYMLSIKPQHASQKIELLQQIPFFQEL